MSDFVFRSEELITNYLEENDWRRRENSNSTFSVQGLNCYISSEITKDFWLNHVYDTEIRDNYISGAIHIHDLGSYMAYCSGWDLLDLLTQGFRGSKAKVESTPPKHFSTALSQLCNFFFSVAGETAGACAVSSFDTLMAPFIYYDGLTEKQVYQSLQRFIYNMNVATRVGFQAVFSNVTLDIKVPNSFKDRPVMVGGELKDKTYSEFQKEMNVFNRCFFEVLSKGDANGRVFTFPIPTINVTKDFDWDNPEIDNLWDVTAKYGLPYFANLINSNISPDDIMSMCCRLRIPLKSLNKLEYKGGGLFGSKPLTGSLGVVSINLAQAAYLSNTEEEMISRIKELMNISKRSLMIKREKIEEMTDAGLYPYVRHYLSSVKERTGKHWSNHFSTIGLVGGNEACLNLLGKDLSTPEGVSLIKNVLTAMNDELVKYQQETEVYWNLEATPAEGTSFRLAKIDSQNGTGEYFAGDEKVKYYCNSTQLPVDCTSDVFTLLDLQDDIQSMYTGGTVQHVFIGETEIHPETIKNFVRKICENYKLPYVSITPTFSVCPVHGYQAGEHHDCPVCGIGCEVYSRVVGYIRPISNWNDGKRKEFEDRKYFCVPKE